MAGHAELVRAPFELGPGAWRHRSAESPDPSATALSALADDTLIHLEHPQLYTFARLT
jgi:hypothetical protein